MWRVAFSTMPRRTTTSNINQARATPTQDHTFSMAKLLFPPETTFKTALCFFPIFGPHES